jgi:hypothetical protein
MGGRGGLDARLGGGQFEHRLVLRKAHGIGVVS